MFRDEAGNFDTAYVVIEVRKATAEPIISPRVIVMATAVTGGVVTGTALVLLKCRRKKAGNY